MRKGASPTVQGQLDAQENIQPLHLAAYCPNDKAPQLIKALLAAGADLSVTIKGGSARGLRGAFTLPEGTALDIAIIFGLAENAKVLLDAGASAKPLDLQAALDSLPLFEVLLKAGVDPNAGVEWKGSEGPSLSIFKVLCQILAPKLTARHIDLLIEHGATLEPRWVIERIVTQDESECRSSILGRFDRNPDYKYLSSCTIQSIGQWKKGQRLPPGMLPDYVSAAADAATELAEQDEQVFVNPRRGTDLLEISCYAATPEGAKKRAEEFLAKLTEWQEAYLKKLTAKEDPATGVKPTAEEVITGGKFWTLHEAPQLPKEKITWK